MKISVMLWCFRIRLLILYSPGRWFGRKIVDTFAFSYKFIMGKEKALKMAESRNQLVLAKVCSNQ